MRIIASTGSLSHLATECQYLGISPALFITDQNIVRNIYSNPNANTSYAGIKTTLYHDVQADPSEYLVVCLENLPKPIS